MNPSDQSFLPTGWRHLNKLRWLSLSLVFLMLVLIPFLYLYQTYTAAHAYDLLAPEEKVIYDAMEWLTAPFIKDPEHDLDVIKGTTWSGQFGALKLSDPLAVVGQIAATGSWYWPLILSAALPLVLTLLFGRFYCGWICPATFLYELNSGLRVWLARLGLSVGNRRMHRNTKYYVLLVGIVLAPLLGTVTFAAVYPPALIGRELYYAIALSGFGVGAVFFAGTLLFDLLVARRGFCRYLCPGGALYSLFGRYRLIRIQRKVEHCNDCAKCNAICEFGLDPLRDGFGQECNNCSACIAVCPTDALRFEVRVTDRPNQGAGHLGKNYRRQQNEA